MTYPINRDGKIYVYELNDDGTVGKLKCVLDTPQEFEKRAKFEQSLKELLDNNCIEVKNE